MYVMSWNASTFINTFSQITLIMCLNTNNSELSKNISNSKELGQGFESNAIIRSILADGLKHWKVVKWGR